MERQDEIDQGDGDFDVMEALWMDLLALNWNDEMRGVDWMGSLEMSVVHPNDYGVKGYELGRGES